MSRRPTKRAVVFVGVGGLLVVVGSTAQAGWLFVLAAVVFGVVAWSLFARSRLGYYEATRLLHPRVTVGDELQVQVSLRNSSDARFAPGVRAVDTFESFEPVALVSEGLAPSEVSKATVLRRALRRGVYSEGEIVLVSGWPFGLMQSKRTLSVASPITVLPRVVELRRFPLSESTSTTGPSERPAARAGAGQQFLGVREYRTGDDARHIHWRSSARQASLVVREYEDEAVDRVFLLLSGTEDGRAPDSSFESLVSAAASVARHALSQNLRVELARTGPKGAVERLTSSSLREILDWFASARPIDGPLLPLVPASMSSGDAPGTVVLFSTSNGHAAQQVSEAIRLLRSRGTWVVAVIADSASWRDGDAGPPVPEVSGPRRVLTQGCELAECLQG